MTQKNHNREMEDQIRSISPGTSLLLHTCCAPCATAVLERLAPHFELHLLFYNPNIQPREEYLRRRQALEHLVSLHQGPFPLHLLEEEQNPAPFLAAAQGLESQPEGGARCRACFILRLGEAARAARELSLPYFATTLTVSPKKDAALLNEIGQEKSAEYGISYLISDFKKKDGYLRSIRRSEALGLYRQTYCGCLFPPPPSKSGPLE